jgi:Fic family protein
MRSFLHPQTFDPVPGDVVTTLRQVDRSAGAEGRFADQLPQLLNSLQERAKVESVSASSSIEGVLVDDSRIPELISGASGGFRTRSEAEFAGYSRALDYLYQGDPGDLSVGLVMHLHRLLFSFTDGRGGHFKTEDNLVVDHGVDGVRRVRFTPASASQTPFFMHELVVRTSAALEEGMVHPLIVTSAFVLDFSCIHPFADGNGRIARLLTSYLMERAEYRVGRYVSLEKLIYETKDEYYDALAFSTAGWFDDGVHDLWPWARYLLGRIRMAYDQFDARIAASTSGRTKQSRVRDYVLQHAPATFTIADVRRAVPGVSDNSIRIVLGELKVERLIASDGTGRSATWSRF